MEGNTIAVQGMDSDRTLTRVGGVTAILSAVLYAGTAFASSLSPVLPDDPSQYAAYLQQVNDNPVGNLLYGWFGILAGLFAIFSILGFHKVLRDVGDKIWLPIVALLIGGILLVFPYFPSLMIVFGLTNQFAGEAFDAEALKVMMVLIFSAQSLFWAIGSILTLTFGVGLFGYYSLNESRVPKWVAWLGIVSGVMALAWIYFFIPEPVNNILLIVATLGLVAFAIYFISMGVIMIRWQE